MRLERGLGIRPDVIEHRGDVVLVPLPKRCAAEMLECEELADLALVIEIEWPASGQVRDDRERRRLALSERPLNVVDGFAASGSLAAIEVLMNRGVADPNQLGVCDDLAALIERLAAHEPGFVGSGGRI
jgi:hypothetical protein